MSFIDQSTVGLLSMALDATALRQRAIAQNIANANTPGYQRIGVSFETHLGALQNTLKQGGTPSLASLRDLRPMLEPVGKPGDPVALDMEVAALSDNTLQQQALLKVLNKHMSLLSTAVNEGKR
ncbi:flagellar basal body rod protein FlgB [Pseudoduganella chitinolytica]|uniref:Flagellar basal body rod protein FlgB n=1 Tax=Pseudoduganella chitinolytica TaxID=34070 RepID=A0ABY8BAK1_9BURK|nr:flagellar basal body rod protein FlgB [Pseudoduganella chitinolytica]WEF32845.1 flagellar basal body rod protein FlgB [Pseudoduganella chitinolytica]